jgi:hypothetical protein
MPEPTDLVTDLPADFEVFGQAVDTDFQDLLGGTTGQVLSKTSGTDLDFTWIDNDQGDITGVTAGTGITVTDPTGPVPTVTNSMATAIDAKGDLIAGTAADTFSRLAIGANDTVLTADSSEATGLKWATPSGGGLVKISTVTLSSSSAATFNDVFSSTYDNYRIVASFSATPTADLPYRFRVAGSDNTTSNYSFQLFEINGSSTFAGRNTGQSQGRIGTAGGDESSFAADIFAPYLGIKKRIVSLSSRGTVGTPEALLLWNGFNDTTSFTGISIYPTSSTFSGEITIYGYAK